MKLQHRINNWQFKNRSTQWPTCRKVNLRDGVMYLSLAFERTYDLVKAYGDDVHIRFTNAQNDEDLVSFLEDWGPLSLSSEEAQRGVMSVSLAYYSAFRRWLRALIDLLAAFKRTKGERAALQEFVEAEYAKDSVSDIRFDEPVSISQLKLHFGISGDVVDWVKQANLPEVRFATESMVKIIPFAVGGSCLVCTRKAGHPRVEATWGADSLEEALRWMVWFDEFTQHPIVCCQECRTVFRSETAHTRKYCSPDCAHRATGRDWQRKKRASERRIKKQGSAKGKE